MLPCEAGMLTMLGVWQRAIWSLTTVQPVMVVAFNSNVWQPSPLLMKVPSSKLGLSSRLLVEQGSGGGTTVKVAGSLVTEPAALLTTTR